MTKTGVASSKSLFENHLGVIAKNESANTAEIQNEYDDTTKIYKKNPTSESLGLIAKKVGIRYCEYKISNQPAKMLASETISLSTQGISFVSSVNFPKGTLLRVWVEIPNFWNLKSKLVEYSHTDAPEYFQMLSRSVFVEENGKRNPKFNILAETVNLDPADERLLSEFLFLIPEKVKKSSLTKKGVL
jgi:hypothetical protein